MSETLQITINCGDPDDPMVYDFVCRKPSPSEAAKYLDASVKAPSTAITINFVKSITQSVNGATGINAIKLIDEMAGGCDGYEDVANEVFLAAGYPNPRRARELSIRASTHTDDLEKMGLPSNLFEELGRVYKAPRQLKAIQYDGFPVVVIVTPAAADVEAKERTDRDSTVRAHSDLGAACTVYPRAIADRNEIWKAYPGLAFQLGVEAMQMRSAIKRAEKKG